MTLEAMDEKELNSKIETLFGNEEKNKLYFLKKFLKQLEKECEKTDFILKKGFSENKVIIILNSEITEKEMRYSLYPSEKGIKFVFRDLDDKDREDCEVFLENNLIPFSKDKISNNFCLNYLNYPNIVFRILEKLIIEEKIREYPENYALKEFFFVLNKIHFDFRIKAKFKISELLKEKSYPKLLEKKYKIKLKKKYRRIPIELLDFMFFSNLKEEDEFILDFLKNKSKKALNVIESLVDFSNLQKFHILFFVEFLELSENLDVNLVRLCTLFKEKHRLYFKTDAERNLWDIQKMLNEVNVKNIFQRILKLENSDDLRKLHDKIAKKHLKISQNKIPERKLSISPKFDKAIKEIESDTTLSFLKVISNQKELHREGIKQENCVYSYLRKIEDGKCIILSGKYKNTDCTIEIINFLGTFSCEQCVTKYNKKNTETEELTRIIENKLNHLNQLAKKELLDLSNFRKLHENLKAIAGS
jgi:hypothetical protein